MSKRRSVSSSAKIGMRNSRLLMELEALAGKLGIQVTHEKLSSSQSGICKLYDKYMIFVDSRLREEEQVEVLISALSRFPLDDLQVLPRIRNLLRT